MPKRCVEEVKKKKGIAKENSAGRLYLGLMKLHLAAIAFNERELETYVSQLRTGGFEAVSDVKKSEDGTYYQALAKTVRQDAAYLPKPAAMVAESFLPQA